MAAGDERGEAAPPSGAEPVGKVGRTPPDAPAETLAGAASHDINNALTGIFGGLDFAEDALARGAFDRLGEDLQQIREAADRLVQIAAALHERSRAEPPAPRPAPPASPAAPSRGAPGPGRVLVVEDEPTILEVVVQALGSAYDVVACTSSRTALARVRAGEDFDVILCDLTMAELDGPAVYEALHAISPALSGRMIFMSGGAFTPRTRAFLEGHARPHLAKPFAIPALREAVAEAVARARSDGTPRTG